MSQLSFHIQEVIKSSQRILYDISLDTTSPSIICILGSNGAGKSTLIETLCYNKLGDGSTFSFDGIALSDLPSHLRSEFISSLSSEVPERPRATLLQFLNLENKQNSTRIEKLLHDWCLLPKADTLLSQLSEGEFQIALLLSTFLREKPIIFLDEPEKHLDPKYLGQLKDSLLSHKNDGKHVIIATHSIFLALQISDRILGLKNGRQYFFESIDAVINQRLLDTLFDVEFQYFRSPDGTPFVG